MTVKLLFRSFTYF